MEESKLLLVSAQGSYDSLNVEKDRSTCGGGGADVDGVLIENEPLKMKRHITMWQCVGIIIGNVIGAGIFTSPKGVIEKINSVGATLVVWFSSGIYALCQALCYAELGSVIPKAGGDYAYIYHILGPLPGFMCAWLQISIVCCASNGVISRTGGLYLVTPFKLDCMENLITLIGVFIIVTCAVINMVDVKLATRVQNICSFAKVFALFVIIVTGAVHLFQGHLSNFHEPFKDTTTNPGLIAMSVLNGYYSYKGWELVNTLPEEMINPKRDLPRAVWIAMFICTFIYVLTNAAYFSMITPEEMVASDAVALTFMRSSIGRIGEWLVSVFVVVSCLGTINGSFLSDSRYIFAAGRYGQLPSVTAMIHTKFFTPLLAIMIVSLVSTCYSLVPEISTLQVYSSIASQMKICLSIIALFYLRWKRPDLPRPVRVNTFLAVVTFLILVTLLSLGLYEDPVVVGGGMLLFMVGIPVYYLAQNGGRIACIRSSIDGGTRLFQKVFLVVPESSREAQDHPKDI